ncbi:alpha/beta hydrolase [Nocardia sp. NPDC023852]|uniref:alpha/beta hydrolase n=1 Tax=Nocardia sp. NPDC023852 TaxID=3154697 RepID=UPI0033C0E0CE
MTLHLPPWLPTPVMECVVGHFPVADEDRMRRDGDYWSDKAEWCRGQATYMDAKAAQRHTTIRGRTGDAIEDGYKQLAESFRSQADYNDQLAEQLYDGANNLELQKWTVIGFAVILAWTLTHAAITFAAGGAIEAYLAKARTETALQIARRKLLEYLAGQGAKYAAERSTLVLARNAAIIGVLQGGGINAAVQLKQIADDNRESMDLKSAGIATAAGGVGGASGAVFGQWLGRRWIVPATVSSAERAGSTAGRVAFQIGGTALVGAAGGLAGGVAGTGVAILLSGEKFTRETFTEGLLPAVTSGFLGAASHAARHIHAATPTSPVAAVPDAPPGTRDLTDALAQHGIRTHDYDPDNPPPAHQQKLLDSLHTLLRQGNAPTADVPAGALGEPTHAAVGGKSGAANGPAQVSVDSAAARPPQTVSAKSNSFVPRIDSEISSAEPNSGNTAEPEVVATPPADSATEPVSEPLADAEIRSSAPHYSSLDETAAASEPAGPGSERPLSPDNSAEQSGRPETEDRTTSVDESGKPAEEPTTRSEPESDGEDAADAAHEGKPLPDDQPDTASGEREAPLSAGDAVRRAAEEALQDYEARSGQDLPEEQRLVNASDEKLMEMLVGDPADATAALIEVIRRGEDKVLRWTQVAALIAMRDGPVDMDAGEGKSLVFLAHAARDAVEHGAVQVITTRDNLANREFTRYQSVLSRVGFDVVRMNPDHAPPPPAEGRPTIYIGTQQDVGFAALRENWVPGRRAAIDEIDEALVHADTRYILSDGAAQLADPETVAQVTDARDFLVESLDRGLLTETDFGREPNQRGGRAMLTDAGRAKLEALLKRAPDDNELRRLDMAASARWEYVENVHYVVHEINGHKKIFIIDQTTHKVMFDPETSTESRWNGGMAQAIEAERGLEIRNDPNTSKSITAQRLFGRENYNFVTGASGTAEGSAATLQNRYGLGEVIKIDRFTESRLEVMADTVAPDEAAKLQNLAADIATMQETGRPQLILCDRNDIVAALSKLVEVDHVAVDAKWFLQHGTRAEDDLQQIFDAAGERGKVLIINMQGARGVDIPINATTRELGGLHVAVTGRSALSRDIDIQAENRAARNGDPGSVRYYTSSGDDLYALSDNPLVQYAVIQYREASAEHHAQPTSETQARLVHTEDTLRSLVEPLQEAAAQHQKANFRTDHTSGPSTPALPALPADSNVEPPQQHPPHTGRAPQIPSSATHHTAPVGPESPVGHSTSGGHNTPAGQVVPVKHPQALDDLEERPIDDLDTVPQDAREGHAAATDALPSPRSADRRIEDCAVRLTRTLRALGNDNTPEPDENDPAWQAEDNWRVIETNIHAQLTAIDHHPTTTGGTDPLATIADNVRTKQDGADTAVIVVDDGTDAHGYIITNVDGNLIVFDTLIEDTSPRVRNYDGDENGDNKWQPTYHHIEQAFVAYFKDDNGTLGALHQPHPGHEHRAHPPHRITGSPTNSHGDEQSSDPVQVDGRPTYLGRALPRDVGFTDEQRQLADAALRAGGFADADTLQRRGDTYIADAATRRAFENAQWWHSLSDLANPGQPSAAQQALIQVFPHQIGNADGIPAVIRDRANRLSISRDLGAFNARRPPDGRILDWFRTGLTAAESKQFGNLIHTRNHLAQLDQQAREVPGSPPVHVLSYDSAAFDGDGKAVVALGNVDTAHTVNWHVPGTNTTSRSLAYQFKPLRNLYEETLRVDRSLELASIIWIGYDAPTGTANTGYLKAAFHSRAEKGGDLLLSDIAAFHATRQFAGTADPDRLRNRIYGHSYGSVTTCYAGRYGRLAGLVASITLSGSPGAGPLRNAAEFGIGAENVFVAASWRDLVTMFGADQPGPWSRIHWRLGLGMDPASEKFGGRRIGAEFPDSPDFAGVESVHQGYLHYDSATGLPTEALANVAQITAGRGETLVAVDRRQPGRRIGSAPVDCERGRYDDGRRNVVDQKPLADADRQPYRHEEVDLDEVVDTVRGSDVRPMPEERGLIDTAEPARAGDRPEGGPSDHTGTARDAVRQRNDCVARVAQVVSALGSKEAREAAAGRNDWRTVETAIAAQLTKVELTAHTDDLLAPIVAAVENRQDGADTAVIVVDDGTNAHGYVITNVEGAIVVFDTNIEDPDAQETDPDDTPTPRVRTLDRWKQSYPHIEEAFVAFLGNDNGDLSALHEPVPDHLDRAHPRHRITGRPTEPDGQEVPDSAEPSAPTGLDRFCTALIDPAAPGPTPWTACSSEQAQSPRDTDATVEGDPASRPAAEHTPPDAGRTSWAAHSAPSQHSTETPWSVRSTASRPRSRTADSPAQPTTHERQPWHRRRAREGAEPPPDK